MKSSKNWFEDSNPLVRRSDSLQRFLNGNLVRFMPTTKIVSFSQSLQNDHPIADVVGSDKNEVLGKKQWVRACTSL